MHLQGCETLSGLLRVPFGPRGPLTRRVWTRSLGMTPGPPTNPPAAPAHPDHCPRARGSGAGPGAQPTRRGKPRLQGRRPPATPDITLPTETLLTELSCGQEVWVRLQRREQSRTTGKKGRGK